MLYYCSWLTPWLVLCPYGRLTIGAINWILKAGMHYIRRGQTRGEAERSLYMHIRMYLFFFFFSSLSLSIILNWLVNLFYIYLSIYLYIYISIFLSIYVCMYLSIYLSIYPPTWAWVKRTLLFLRCERGNWRCCLESIPQAESEPICPPIDPIELPGPRIKLLTKIDNNSYRVVKKRHVTHYCFVILEYNSNI